jgi:oligo-1,6-glucosidase
MNFWLERGACGYRMDVINLISKDQRFPDAEPTLGPDRKYHPGSKYYVNGPRMHEYLQEIKQKVLEKHGAITVGEMPGVSDIDEILRTVKGGTGELNMIFIFDLVGIDNAPGQVRMTLHKWSVKDLSRIVTKWQTAMIERNGWNSVFCENHDNPRSVSRYCDGSDAYREYGAKLLALMQTTLSGTLFVYQGEELGMRNVPKSWDIMEEYKDIESINFWKKSKDLYGNDPKRLAEERKVLEEKARDHARTPMQWDGSANAGFCNEGVAPWMRVNDDYKSVNAEKQIADDDSDDLSVWQYWQRGLANRKEHADVFVYGEFEAVTTDSDEIFAYVRTGKKSGKWLVVLNFSGKEVKWDVPKDVKVGGWMAGNYLKGKPEKPLIGSVEVRPWEGMLGMCED